ncbi:MAG: FlgD immunoglobulin-like domain containing protein [Candidatus Krumholzibacteriia bacterium]
MKRLALFVCLLLAPPADPAQAVDPPANSERYTPALAGSPSQLNGAVVGADKAAVDTVYVLGGPGTNLGKFQSPGGAIPDRQGWIGFDATQKTVVRWQASTFNAEALDPDATPNYAMWCGETFAAGCGGDDPPEGYGNRYDEWLDWYGTVADNTAPTSVTVTAVVNNDSEPGYDFLQFEVQRAAGMTAIGPAYSGINPGMAFSQTFSVDAADYVGVGNDQVHLRWRATSDGAWSDGDCLWPTAGHSQIDNIRVSFDGVQQTSDDFQPGSPPRWAVAFPPGVGDFSKVWPRLADLDPCTGNSSPQFAFIDDGIVVPGTGGTLGTTWTYGPGGYVVNWLGGLAGLDHVLELDNQIWSPPLDWPSGDYDGGRLEWDVYAHLPLENCVFFRWRIRNSTDGGITWGPWRSDGYLYYGGGLARSLREAIALNAYLTPGRDKIQVSLGVDEHAWDIVSPDPTPAPYIDNVAVRAFPIGGQAITARDIDLFNDGWPAAATIDYVNLANNSVRLDMASNIAPRLDLRNDPGDSIVLTVAPSRLGSQLDCRPTLHVVMRANPLFDGVRALPVGFIRTGARITGAVPGDTIRVGGVVQENRWSWDLPDTGFFFPGDALHYCIEARDNLAGDVRTALLPGDTTGISLFPGDDGYATQRVNEVFKVDALPTMHSATAGDQPHLLFWNDAQGQETQDEWFGALDNLGYRRGVDYDVYGTNGPTSGVGNGLGGRTNHLKMSGYSTLLYTCGNLSDFTFGFGSFNGDPSNDVAVVDAWLSLGGRSMFATGDKLISSLLYSSATSHAFLDKWFLVSRDGGSLRLLINGQASPGVSPVVLPGAPALSRPYIAFGGCPLINDFDAVSAKAPAVRIAEFTDPTGATGAYPYAAAVYNYVAASTARIVLMPYDLGYVCSSESGATVRPARADILLDVLAFLGQLPGGPAVGVTPELAFTARNYPNPFNPGTRIAFTLPRAGRVELKVYNVRGELVATLLDEARAAGPHAVAWDGRDSAGRAVSSGVYFYSLKAGGQGKMEKMTLVK